MIKKSIASILIILILINSIGCYSYSQIKKEDAEKIKKDDEVKITTLDEKVYYLTEVEIQRSVLKGNRFKVMYRKDHRLKVEVSIPIDQIKNIEIEKFNYATTVLTVVLTVGVLIAIPVIIFVIAMRDARYH